MASRFSPLAGLDLRDDMSLSNEDHSDEESSSDGEAEWQLLDSDSEDAAENSSKAPISSHDLATAPLLTREAYVALNQDTSTTQYGVLGKVRTVHHNGRVTSLEDGRLYVNTNAPFSALICGVQGAGKSHTVSTILENMLISNFSAIGSLKKPLAGLVLHFGEGGSSSLPNEAAFLSKSLSSHVKGAAVRIYVSRSSLKTMRNVYSGLGKNVVVEPLLFHNSELDAAAFLSMMAVGSAEGAPLYMQIILSILRDLGEDFTYARFMEKLQLSKKKFNPAQLTGLEQRLSLLNSFLESSSSKLPRKSRFAAGQLTIVDLSDPFLDAGSACGLFEIVVRLFVRAEVKSGKVLVVDEAHKYLSQDKAAGGLTNSLLSLIRQQRHLAMRVIISTQEPTVVPPVLIDLCTIVVVHRFQSPAWWQHIVQHIPTDFNKSDAFDQVVRLETGHAIVIAPAGLGIFSSSEASRPLTSGGEGSVSVKDVTHFGRRYFIIKMRRRVTADGGASVLVL